MIRSLKPTPLFILSMFLLLFSCEEEVSIEEPIKERQVNIVSSQDIPEVMASIGNTIGLGDETKTSSAKVSTDYGDLEIDEVVEMIDTLENKLYTFSMIDNDEDPLTFSNLLVRKNSNGSIETPYINEYKVSKMHVNDFINSGLSMSNFTGVKRKTYLDDFRNRIESSANIKGQTSSDPCDDNVTYYQSGNNIGNGPSGDFDNYNTDNTNNDDASPEDSNIGTGGTEPTCWEEVVYTINYCVSMRYKAFGRYKKCYTYDVIATYCDDTPISHTEVDSGYNPCTIPEEIGVIIPDEEFRKIAINNHVKENPFSLIEIECDQISNWIQLYQHEVPQSVVIKIDNLDKNNITLFDQDWNIQYINDADGPVINMDYFAVKIEQMPINESTGARYTKDEFFNYVRKNLNSFFEGNSTEFSAYNNDENSRWQSNSYLGTIMRFDISVLGPMTQDGSVVCSNQSDNSWIFTTIKSPADWNHPVSGHRQFGLIENMDGTYTFYTRGVDRVAEWFDGLMGNVPFLQNAFEGADQLWTQFQNNLVDFVNNPENPSNKGVALKNVPNIQRPDFDIIRDVLEGRRPIGDLGCE